MPKVVDSRRLPVPLLLGYGTGQTGAQIFRDTPAALLPLFMTTMLGVPAWLAGLVILGPKLWLIVCDPLMGSWSDRVKPRAGRTPFLSTGALLTSAGFLLLFWFTSFGSPYVAAAVVMLLFLVASTAFSAYSVPYLAVASELSASAYERTRILAYRMLFTYIGGILGYGLSQPVIFYFGGRETGWRVMAALYAGICLVSMLTPAFSLRRVRLLAGEAGGAQSLLGQLNAARCNRPFVILTAGSFLMSASQAVCYTVVSFIFIYLVQDVSFILPFALSMMAGGLASQPMWLALTRRFSKFACFLVASIAWGLVLLTFLWLKPGGDVLTHLPVFGDLTDQKLWVLVRGVLLGITNSGFVLMSLSMLTDAIDQQRRTAGRADEGVFSGIFSAVEKLSFAIGPLIAGVGMSLTGFQSSTMGVIEQSNSAITGILWIYAVVPVVVQLASLAVFARYPEAARRAEAACVANQPKWTGAVS